MNKQEILSAAKKQGKRGCEAEARTEMISNFLGTIVALTTAIALCLWEWIAEGAVDYRLLTVITVTLGIQLLYEGIKNKKVTPIIFGVIQLLIAIVAIVMVVIQ